MVTSAAAFLLPQAIGYAAKPGGFGVAAGPLLSGILVAWGFAVPFAFAALLAGVGVAIVLTQVEEVNPPRRAIPMVGRVT
jgi:MFS family permease